MDVYAYLSWEAGPVGVWGALILGGCGIRNTDPPMGYDAADHYYLSWLVDDKK